MENQDLQRKQMMTGNNDLVEDLVDWSGKLKALGGILSRLAWYESKDNVNTSALVAHGEQFGAIINDYAEFIETAVNDNIGEIRGFSASIEAMRSTGKI